MVQKSMVPLFTNVAYTGTGNMSGGDINIVMIPGCININLPVKERPFCSWDYRHNSLTRFDGEKRIYTNDDSYGLRFMKTPTNEQLNPGGADAAAVRQKQAAIMDSMSRLMAAKKITYEQYSKALENFAKNISDSNGASDIKKLEANNNLYIKIIINPVNKEIELVKVTDKNKTVVQHNIHGAAFEIFTPLAKDTDGDWINNRYAIYFGKFTPPVMGKSGGGFDAETTNALYPVNGNKLSVYNIIIRMEGGKDLIDKAVANIDFNALLTLITKQ